MSAASILWPATKSQNAYDVEPEDLLGDFEASAPLLFEQEEDINVTIQEYRDQGPSGTRSSPGAGLTDKSFPATLETSMLGSTGEVLEYTQRPEAHRITRVISIPKLFSDSELQISAKAIQELFTSLKISPGFWSVVKRFGVKDQEEKCVHESSGGFNEESWEPFSKSYGFSYNVKYVEHHGRETYDPWSMRQIGLHHEYDHETQNNTFIILNPSKALTSRLNNVTAPIEPVAIHRMVLASVTERWNDYLAYLEYCFGDISKKGLLANPTRNTSAVEVRFSDSQRIQKLQDTMLRVSQMLSMNMSVFDHLLSSPDLSSSMSRAVDGLENLSHSRSLASLRTQTKLRLQRSDNLLRRLDGSSALVRSILDAQSLSTLQDSSQTTAELAALAREDSRKATKDARTLSTITILGFVYLPASFVATLLGTQYIHVDGARSGIWMNSEMWIFLVLTAILLLVTVGGWAVWERQNSLADRKQAEVEDQREKSV